MNQPGMNDFDMWKLSPVGQWYFDVHLKKLAEESAYQNGVSAGIRESSLEADHMHHVWQAGWIHGVLDAIANDPFIEEREAKDESESGR